MHRYELDSYQNIVCSPGGNESVESIGPGPDRDSVEHAAGDTEGEHDGSGRERRAHDGQDEEAGHGRGTSGESYEDEADNSLLGPKREEAFTTDTYDGGNLSPSGKTLGRARAAKREEGA